MDSTKNEAVYKRMRKILLATLFFTVCAIGLVMFGRLVMRLKLRQMDFGNPSNQRAALAKVLDSAQVAVNARPEKCRVVLDESSLGNSDQEAKMLLLADLLRIYQAESGKAPRSVSELQKDLSGSNEAKSVIDQLRDYWFVYDDTSAWVVLGYGGWRPFTGNL